MKGKYHETYVVRSAGVEPAVASLRIEKGPGAS